MNILASSTYYINISHIVGDKTESITFGFDIPTLSAPSTENNSSKATDEDFNKGTVDILVHKW